MRTGSWPNRQTGPWLTGHRCGIRTKQILVLSQEKMIGHSGNVITYDSMAWPVLGELGVRLRHGFRMIEVELEQLTEGFHGPLAVHHDGRMVVQLFVQKLLERSVFPCHLRAESRQTPRQTPPVFDAVNA